MFCAVGMDLKSILAAKGVLPRESKEEAAARYRVGFYII